MENSIAGGLTGRLKPMNDEPCETCGEKLTDRPECGFSDCTNKVMKSIELKTSKGEQVLLYVESTPITI
jgi:hypothetical protein